MYLKSTEFNTTNARMLTYTSLQGTAKLGRRIQMSRRLFTSVGHFVQKNNFQLKFMSKSSNDVKNIVIYVFANRYKPLEWDCLRTLMHSTFLVTF